MKLFLTFLLKLLNSFVSPTQNLIITNAKEVLILLLICCTLLVLSELYFKLAFYLTSKVSLSFEREYKIAPVFYLSYSYFDSLFKFTSICNCCLLQMSNDSYMKKWMNIISNKLEFRQIHFFFSYYSWVSQGKNTEVVSHSLLQLITFCQNSSP